MHNAHSLPISNLDRLNRNVEPLKAYAQGGVILPISHHGAEIGFPLPHGKRVKFPIPPPFAPHQALMKTGGLMVSHQARNNLAKGFHRN